MTAIVNGAKAPTVLVVDDEPDVRLLVRFVLEKSDFEVVAELEDGSQALDQFSELDPPDLPSIVLLDNRMPGLTGLEVAGQMLSLHPDQVIVLFSAHLDPRIEQQAREVGITACVSKLDATRLPEILHALLSSD